MEGRIFFKQSRKLIVVTILFLLLATLPAYARLWGNKVDTQDLQRIITELRIYDDPNLPYYNEIFSLYYSGYTGSEELLDALNKKIEITQQVIKILDADIKKEELGNLTYGRYILNAINEKELVEIGIKTGSPGQAKGEYFNKLGENLADWESQLSKLLLTKIIVATCTAMGAPALSIGISTLGLFCDLSIIKTSINKLNEVWYEKAFWSYMQFRNEPNNYDHIDAWKPYAEPYVNYIIVLSLEKQKKARKAIEENFESLWNKYGDHIVNNELDKNFKSQQRESLKILLLYALEAEPHPIITSPLKITPVPPYYIGDIINAEFTITNQGKLPINFSVLTVGGRDPDNQVADFSHRQNITLEPSKSYNYQGTLALNKVGDYHFFCTYQTSDGNWNTCVDLGSGLTDEDRTEDISVKEKPFTVPDVSEELYIEWDMSFEITDYQSQLKILENGDILVNEIFEYNFDGDFNGIIRTIGIKGSDGLQYFKASQYLPEEKELNYDKSVKGDMVTYKIYDKSSNERKLFLLEYQLKNVVTLYNDTAEFYWKFFDESNTSPIGHVKIEVELPGEASKEELKVFGHGPLDAEISIQEDGKIVYEVYGLSSGEMVGARILFPTNLVPDSIKKFNENKFTEIMEEELGIIEALEEEVTEVSSSENYYPLDEGRRWEYQVLLKQRGGWYIGPDSESGSQVVTNFPQRELKGKRVIPRLIEYKVWGSSRNSFWFYIEDQSGVYEFAYQYPEDVEPKIIHDYIIKYPIKVGNIWQEIETSLFKPKISIPVKSTIESINEVVTVPAGTFKGCLKIKTIGFAEKVVGKWLTEEEKVKIDREWYKWFAPGVGLIKMIFKEKKTCTGGIMSPSSPEFREITMQLKTFK